MRLKESLRNKVVSGWLLELCISFYTSGGENDDYERRLVNSVVTGLRLDGRNPQHCELPQEALESLPARNFPAEYMSFLTRFLTRVFRNSSETTLSEYFHSNRHVLMVVLLALANDLVKA